MIIYDCQAEGPKTTNDRWMTDKAKVAILADTYGESSDPHLALLFGLIVAHHLDCSCFVQCLFWILEISQQSRVCTFASTFFFTTRRVYSLIVLAVGILSAQRYLMNLIIFVQIKDLFKPIKSNLHLHLRHVRSQLVFCLSNMFALYPFVEFSSYLTPGGLIQLKIRLLKQLKRIQITVKSSAKV